MQSNTRGVFVDRAGAAVEVTGFLLVALFFPFSMIPLGSLFLLALATASLAVRNRSWGAVGLIRPASWPRLVGLAVLLTAAVILIGAVAVVPLAEQVTGTGQDFSALSFVRGDLAALFAMLAVAWVFAAFGEELLFRGFLLNRIADAFGGGRFATAMGAVGSSLAFGAVHLYQGAAGIVSTTVVGLMLAVVYLLFRRNLWLVIVMHGLIDTVSLTGLYLGLI